MNELALFAGTGGGLLGSILLGWTPVCAVEKEPYCREVLLRRQRDGMLPLFPIWDDIQTFTGDPWRGYVDVVTAGFPCQPYSAAKHGRGNEASLWKETYQVITTVVPKFVFLENVPGVSRDLSGIRNDLQAMGYCVHSPAKIAAACVGAPHIRERVWVFAHAYGHGEPACAVYDETPRVPPLARVAWWTDWAAFPPLMGDVDGLAHRMDRLRAIGNGQVPGVVEAAWRLLAAKTKNNKTI